MKAKLLRDMETVAVDDDRVVMKEMLRNGSYVDVPHFPVGTEIEDPSVFLLVKMGVAEPVDDECRERAGMTDEQLKLAQERYAMVEKGIHPDDYERYLNGEITGYEDGEDVPGPNAIEEEYDGEIFIP